MSSRALVLACLLSGSVGCDEDPSDRGTAPTIEDLELDASALVVGSASALRGQLWFTDADGDVSDAELTLRQPSGAESSVSTPTQGTAGLTEGSVGLQITVLAPEPGEYEVRAVLHDAEGNTSEPVISMFSVG